MTDTASSSAGPIARRRVQAVLAGGLVLGVGAAVTLASWNDSEFADGIFGSASFNLEGSTDGTAYSDHASSDAAAEMTFAADNMTPGETVYSPFWVRLDADTTVDGTIEAADGIGITESTGTNTANLSYEVTADPDSCDAAGAGTGSAVASGADLSTGIGSTSAIDLTAGDDAAGAPVQLCFAVTAAEEEFAQGDTTEVTWEVLATSVDNS